MRAHVYVRACASVCVCVRVRACACARACVADSLIGQLTIFFK